MNEFEQRLNRQPQKEIPSAWRAEILAAAHEAQAARHLKQPRPSSILHFLSSLLWPHPKAWAGLAVVWMVIVGLQLAARDDSGSRVTAKAAPPSPEMMVELRKQQRMFAELVGPREEPVADRSKSYSPKPRTGRVEWVVG
jgi:hypothetical protein